MNFLNVMFVVWVCLVAAFTAVMVYRGHLNNHETDQLFLSDNVEYLHQEHDEVVRRATFIQPICNGLGVASALATMLIVGTYLVQQAPNMRFQ